MKLRAATLFTPAHRPVEDAPALSDENFEAARRQGRLCALIVQTRDLVRQAELRRELEQARDEMVRLTEARIRGRR